MSDVFSIPWEVKDVFSLLKGREDLLVKAKHGLEKESLRVDQEGRLAMTPHPRKLGDKLTDPYITTDFSESQPEFITPPFDTIEESVKFLEKLHGFAYKRLGNELLWPMSMPARLPAEKDIPIASYGDSPEGRMREIYRRGLALRYGKYMQTICGVHYNLSFSDGLWDVLYDKFGKPARQGNKGRLRRDDDFLRQDFVNEVSMNLVRNFIRYRWLLVYLFGASPNKDESYKCWLMAKDADQAISLRSSRCGYSNPAKLPVTYNSYRQHLADLRSAVDTVHSPYTDLGVEDHGLRVQLNDHLLQLGNEYYFSVRLKPPKPYDDLVEALTRDGVQYVEVRIFDLNPYEYSGVSVRQLYFAHLFLLFCLLTPSSPVDDEVLNIATANQQDVALYGRSPSLYLQRDGKSVLMTAWAKEILASLKPFADVMDRVFSKRVYGLVLEYFMESVDDPGNLPAFRMAADMKKKRMSFIPYGMLLAKKYSLHKF